MTHTPASRDWLMHLHYEAIKIGLQPVAGTGVSGTVMLTETERNRLEAKRREVLAWAATQKNR